jgi:hypothetical protein
MTGTYNSVGPQAHIWQIKYQDKFGNELPMTDQERPYAKEELQLEALALRLLTTSQQERIKTLEARIAELEGRFN